MAITGRFARGADLGETMAQFISESYEAARGDATGRVERSESSGDAERPRSN